jgi:hypothetical protein
MTEKNAIKVYKVLAPLLILPIMTLEIILTLGLLILPSSGSVFALDGGKTSNPDG